MAVLTTCTFSRYIQSEAEFLEGCSLNLSQTQRVQNLLADIADQILGLTFDPKNPSDFAQQDSFLKGQLSAYRHLLEASSEAAQTFRNVSDSSAI